MAPPENPDPPPAPTTFVVMGPPDLLHDVMLDFQDVGWEVDAAGWHAVITAPPEDAGAPVLEWPAEVTLIETSRDDHATACARHLGGRP